MVSGLGGSLFLCAGVRSGSLPVKPHEPWSALGTIAIVCFLVWWWNERRLKTTLAREAAAHDAWTPAPAASAPAKTPAPVIDPMRPMSAAPEHKAA